MEWVRSCVGQPIVWARSLALAMIPRCPTDPSATAASNSSRESPRPVLATSVSLRVAESTLRLTVMCLTLRLAETATRGSRSMTKPGFAPVMMMVRRWLFAAVCIASQM